MSGRLVPVGWLVLCCARGPGVGATEPTERPGILLRNRSPEILCEVYVSPSGTEPDLDALAPDEVVEPGASRFFELADGAHDVQLRDCNGAVVMRREGMRVGPGGFMLTYEERD